MWGFLYHHCGFVWSIKRFLGSYSDNPVFLLKTPRKVVRKPKQVKQSCPNSTGFQRPYTWRCHAVNHMDFCFFSCQAIYSERAWAVRRYLGCVSATTAFTVSVGIFKSTSLRIQLSFVMLLALLLFLFTSTFNTVKTAVKIWLFAL